MSEPSFQGELAQPKPRLNPIARGFIAFGVAALALVLIGGSLIFRAMSGEMYPQKYPSQTPAAMRIGAGHYVLVYTVRSEANLADTPNCSITEADGTAVSISRLNHTFPDPPLNGLMGSYHYSRTFGEFIIHGANPIISCDEESSLTSGVAVYTIGQYRIAIALEIIGYCGILLGLGALIASIYWACSSNEEMRKRLLKYLVGIPATLSLITALATGGIWLTSDMNFGNPDGVYPKMPMANFGASVEARVGEPLAFDTPYHFSEFGISIQISAPITFSPGPLTDFPEGTPYAVRIDQAIDESATVGVCFETVSALNNGSEIGSFTDYDWTSNEAGEPKVSFATSLSYFSGCSFNGTEYQKRGSSFEVYTASSDQLVLTLQMSRYNTGEPVEITFAAR
jgi:hypothetical protein